MKVESVTDFVWLVYEFIKEAPRTREEVENYVKAKNLEFRKVNLTYCLNHMRLFSDIQTISNKVFFVSDEQRKLALEKYYEVTKKVRQKLVCEGAGQLDFLGEFMIISLGNRKFSIIADRLDCVMEEIIPYTRVSVYDDSFYEKIQKYNKMLPEEVKELRRKIKEEKLKVSILRKEFLDGKFSIVEFEEREKQLKERIREMIYQYDDIVKNLGLEEIFEICGRCYKGRRNLKLIIEGDRNVYLLFPSQVSRLFLGKEKKVGVFIRKKVE